jgi:DNA-3-methyladenine glycosylase
MKRLSKNFFNREPTDVAKDLLGKILVRNLNGSIISGRIVETEAYLAFKDEAAHSFRGKTKRTESLFKDAGHLYVYSIHMQNCMDIVCNSIDVPDSVLIRALEPIEGIDLMKSFRNKEHIKDLTTGPGKLCKALDISRQLDGINICEPSSIVYVLDDNYKPSKIIQKSRVGVTKAKEMELRFYIKGNPFVS